MNDALAHERLVGVLELIDRWGDLYGRRWGKKAPSYQEQPALARGMGALIDEVRRRTKLAHDVITAMDEKDLAAKVVEHEEGMYGSHPFNQARVAIVEAIAILAQREELAMIVGPAGPRLVGSELHPAIWGAAATLWDDGHIRPAIQTAATALEGLLQGIAGPVLSGESLAGLFSLTDPTQDHPAFDFAVSTRRRGRGGQRMKVLLHWSEARLWAYAISYPTPAGPNRIPVKASKCWLY